VAWRGAWRWPARLRWIRNWSCTTSPFPGWIRSRWAPRRADPPAQRHHGADQHRSCRMSSSRPLRLPTRSSSWPTARSPRRARPHEVRHSTDPLVHQYVNARATGPVRFHYPAPRWIEDFGGCGLAGGHELVPPARRGICGAASWRMARVAPVQLLPASAGAAPRFGASAWCATRCISWAIIRWPSSRSPACLSALCFGLQGYYTLQRYGSSEAWAAGHAELVRELGPVVTACCLPGGPAPR
jgi:hypothetical protein